MLAAHRYHYIDNTFILKSSFDSSSGDDEEDETSDVNSIKLDLDVSRNDSSFVGGNLSQDEVKLNEESAQHSTNRLTDNDEDVNQENEVESVISAEHQEGVTERENRFNKEAECGLGKYEITECENYSSEEEIDSTKDNNGEELIESEDKAEHEDAKTACSYENPESFDNTRERDQTHESSEYDPNSNDAFVLKESIYSSSSNEIDHGADEIIDKEQPSTDGPPQCFNDLMNEVLELKQNDENEEAMALLLNQLDDVESIDKGAKLKLHKEIASTANE